MNPKSAVMSPKRAVMSPKRTVMSPKRAVMSPKRAVMSPKREPEKRRREPETCRHEPEKSAVMSPKNPCYPSLIQAPFQKRAKTPTIRCCDKNKRIFIAAPNEGCLQGKKGKIKGQNFLPAR